VDYAENYPNMQSERSHKQNDKDVPWQHQIRSPICDRAAERAYSRADASPPVPQKVRRGIQFPNQRRTLMEILH